MKHLKLFEEEKTIEKTIKTTSEKQKMFDKIYNMYSNCILDNEISQSDVLDFVYEVVAKQPELLDHILEKNEK